jgi:hypothetical protein
MVLRRSNMPKRMSALGQKQTFECVGAMSALPPKADIADSGQKRVQQEMKGPFVGAVA